MQIGFGRLISVHQTGKKDVSKQLHANPKAELCAFKGGEWIRVAGELVEDDRVDKLNSRSSHGNF